jgi:hypothetical protein
VAANAPLFVVPDASREPLRVAAAGSVLQVIDVQGEWVNVEFQDPQYGRRVGWLQAKFGTISIDDPRLKPMDLSIPPSPTASTESPATAPQSPAPVPSQPPRVESSRKHLREGFWFSGGLGYGSLGCDGCVGRASGLSGGLTFGGTLSDKWLLGVGTTGWARSDVSLTVGTVDARVRFYPSLNHGFFITGGIGMGSVSFEGESELGVGAIFGVGWDVRVSRNVSLTPFYNGFAMESSEVNANVGQIGLAVTIH